MTSIIAPIEVVPNTLEKPAVSKQYQFCETDSQKHDSDLEKTTDDGRADFDLLLAAAQAVNRASNTGFCYEISFVIHYKTVFGEKIVVTGNTDWLGSWDPLRGFELEWTPGNIWTNSFLLAEGSLPAFEYKYVCVRSNNACRWEQRKNRSLHPQQGLQTGHKLLLNQEETWDK